MGTKFLALVQSDAYLYDGDATFKQAQTKYAYDSFANLIKISSLGDVNVSGDEVYSYAEYMNSPVTSVHYELGIPYHKYIKGSDDATIIGESWAYYSDSYNGASPIPTKCFICAETETAACYRDRG